MLVCKNCGGSILFDIKKQMLVCSHCESEYPVEEYNKSNAVVEIHDYETTYYLCPHCGAEQTVVDDSLVCFCDYCGNEMTVQGRIREDKPTAIVPFKITRKESREIYENRIKKMSYVPKEYKDPEKIQEFRGVYVPYYGFAPKEGSAVEILTPQGYRDYSYSNVSGEYIQDASTRFDDTLTSKVLSKSQFRDEVPFQEGYLAGFYADRADIDSSIYEEPFRELIKADTEARTGGRITPRKEKSPEISTTRKFYPVWFLTFKNKDRVAYIVENGQDGRLSTEIPVDKKKFYLISALITIPVFFLLYLVLTMSAELSMIICTLLGIPAAVLYNLELAAFETHEGRLDDRGYQHSLGRKNMVQVEGRMVKALNMKWYVWAILVAAIVLLQLLTTIPFVPLAIDFALTYVSVEIILPELDEGHYLYLMPALILLIASIFAFLLHITLAANDLYYYLVGFLIILGTGWITFQLLTLYNKLATRPMPGYYNREGGKNDAQD